MTQCVEVGGLKIRGYGVNFIHVGAGKQYALYAHRVAFEQAWGVTLKPGQVVRHSCANPPCVNPLHLMVGTAGDNNRDTVAHGHHRKAQQTHCHRGHALTPDNLRAGARKNSRACKQCHALRERARRHGSL